MNRLRYVFRSLLFFWRVNLAVCLGVAAATAVLIGALLVGDSMRGSLRKISLDGLGQIDEMLVADRFFREALADEIKSNAKFSGEFDRAEPVILFPNASASFKKNEGQSSVANKVTLMGCQDGFWQLASDEIQGLIQQQNLSFDELDPTSTTTPIVLNEPLAKDLGIAQADLQGDEPPVLTVQIPKPQLINADNPIGKKEDLYETIARLRVVAIVPAKSLGRFNLHPSQLLPRILYLPIASVQEALQKEEMANAIFISLKGDESKLGTTPAQSEILADILKPKAADLGLVFKKVEQSYTDESGTQKVFDYTSLSSDQLLLTDAEVDLAMQAFAEFKPQQVLTYLANGLELANSKSEVIPFSMVSSIDIDEEFKLVSAISGQPVSKLNDDQILINSWAAEDFLKTSGVPWKTLSAEEQIEALRKFVGQQLNVQYFEPEASHGKLIPRTESFTIADIAKVVTPAKPFNRRRSAIFDACPTLANDPDLTPFVPGVTDQNSIQKWDLPFKTEVRDQDDDFWQFFRTTPKAMVNLKKGQELWKSRFGRVTSIRIQTDLSFEALEAKLLETAEAQNKSLNFGFTPIKRRNVEASSGSTPFDVLFLALSFFIIAAALILISLLFRLGVDQKVTQLGLLSAVGIENRLVTRLLILEGGIISLIGASLGIVLGVLYAKLMVYGLTTWWVGAVMTSFMEFHWSMTSILIGFVTGVLISVLTIWVSVRRLSSLPTRQMLSGKTDTQVAYKQGGFQWVPKVAAGSFLLAILLSIVAASSLGGEAQAGAFMGGGFLMLSAFLLKIWQRLKMAPKESRQLSGNQLAIQNASRNPLRSTLTIGLVAAATFLIVAVSSFHLTPTEQGTGGFSHIAESSRPIVGDFADSLIREDLLGNSATDLQNLEIYSIRYLPGDEAGCNNPFQAQRPRVLGMTESFVQLFDNQDKVKKGFAFAGSTAKTEQQKANPWNLLLETPDDGTIPVIIDKNTAMYSLKIFGVGGTYEVEFDGGQKVVFRVVGFLSNSTLQGSLIIGEAHFEKLFPQVTGYRSYLIQSSNDEKITTEQVEKLESELANFGFDASDSTEVLAGFLAVQNTYLSTFQTLGAFGLLLGTFGLATVQMRNVVERRKELALLQALGFAKSRLGQIVLTEHSLLLVGGMLVGTLSALFSVVPHLLFGEAQVPFVMLGTVLLAILLIGLVSGLGSVVSTFKTPLLTALRSEN